MLVLYCIPAIPPSVTTLLALAALVAVRAVSFADALGGMLSSAVFLLAGMMVMGRACYTTGIVKVIGKSFYSLTKYDERVFILIMCVVVALLTTVINAVAVLALMMPLLDDIARKTDNRISRKDTYFPLGIASVMGTGLSSISSSNMIAANQLLMNEGYAPLGVFEPAVVNFPALVAVIAFYYFFGCKLQKKFFTFEEKPSTCAVENEEEELRASRLTWRAWFSAAALVGAIIAIMLGVKPGLAAVVGAAAVLVTGCVSVKEAGRGVSWTTLIIVGGSIGISAAIAHSGVAEMAAKAIIRWSGSFGTTTLGLCIILFLVTTLFSNVLAATSAVAIMMPIIFSIASTLGMDVVPLVLACTSGSKFALSTPICTGAMTMIGVPGYRAVDYFRMGGLVNIICLVVTCAVLALIF